MKEARARLSVAVLYLIHVVRREADFAGELR